MTKVKIDKDWGKGGMYPLYNGQKVFGTRHNGRTGLFKFGFNEAEFWFEDETGSCTIIESYEECDK